MPSSESILRIVLIAAIVAVGIVIIILFVPRFLPSPATITPSATAIDEGQSVYFQVSWKGGSAPYTAFLYMVTTGGCSTSSPVLDTVGKLTVPQYDFTYSPNATARYCGSITSAKASSTASPTITVTVNPVFGQPTITLAPSEIDSGQSATVTASVGLVGGTAPYSVTLDTGSSSSCSSDTTAVKVSGANPVTGLAGKTVEFSFPAPSSGAYYCAVATNDVPGSSPVTSSSAKFSVNPSLTATISPASPKLDDGQGVNLTANAEQGTPPYKYQWYFGSSCASPISGETGSTYSTGALSSSGSYSVEVGDNSTGSPAADVCAQSSVAVSSSFLTSTVTISSSASTVDSGQTISLTVTWQSLGTSPYSVELETSASAGCFSPSATGQTATGVSGDSAVIQVSPASSADYCAKVSDGATSPESASTTSAAVVKVNPALAPSVSLSPDAMDSGQTTTVRATVDLSGGTSPYTVTLYSSATSACSTGSTVVSSSQANPQSDEPGPTVTFSFTAPSSSMYYCAKATDSASSPSSVVSSASEFTVEPALTATISPASPAVISGNTITLSAETTGGVSPLFYQWYTSSGCTQGNEISGQKSQTYDTGALKAAASFSVLVTDSSQGTPAQEHCASAKVSVVAVLVPKLSLSPEGVDTGQSTTVDATVSWTGGTANFTVTLHSGSSSSCTSDLTVVSVTTGTNPVSSVNATSTVLKFSSPTTDTYYCAVVKDSTTPPQVVQTSPFEFTVNAPPSSASIVVSPGAIDSGQPATINATVNWSGGTPPFSIEIYSGSSSTCSSDTIARTSVSGVAASPGSVIFSAPSSDTYYCALVTDSGVVHESTTSSTALLTVNPVLVTSPPTLSPSVLDSGQSVNVKATATWSGGSPPYLVTLYGGNSVTCGGDTNVVAVVGGSNPQTGLTASSASFTFASPAETAYYCFSVTDSSGVPVTVSSGTSAMTINPALSATLRSLSPPALDSGQSETISASLSWTGGTAPYSVSLFSGIYPACSADSTPAGSAQSDLFTKSTSIPFASPASSVYYCAKVTDSSGSPVSVTTTSIQFIVNPPPAATITPPSPSVGSGQTGPALTSHASSGTPPYTYQWYTGSTCASKISGQTLAFYDPGVLSTTSAYSVEVTDNSTGSPASVSSVCASVTIAVGDGPEGIAADNATGMIYVTDPLSNHISVIDTFSNTVVTNITTGTLPWGIAIDTVNNIIYVTNYGSGTVSVIDGSTNALCAPSKCPVNTILVGDNPEGIGFNERLGEVYVANSGSNTVSVINSTTDKVIATVNVGTSPQSVAVGPSTFTPPYTPPYTVFVTNYGSDTISIIALTSPFETYPVTTVTVGSNPWGVAVNPVTNVVYVTNSGSGTVSVLNGSTYATLSTVTVGGTPEGIAINPDSSVAYIANPASNTVTLLNLKDNEVISSSSPQAPIPVGQSPWGVAAMISATNPSTPELAYITNNGTNTVTVVNMATNEVVVTIIVS